MKAGDLRDRCPACGVPATAFEPYTDPVAPPRRRILKLDLHPIAVHFPTTLAVAVLVFSVAVAVLSGDARALLAGTTRVLALLLPLAVALSFAVGWLDGKVRFRKVSNSRVLKRKVLYAALLLVVSIGLAFTVWLGAFATAAVLIGAIVLSAVAVVLTTLLALLGTSITGAVLPGK